jgi:deoxyribonuclease-4
MHYVGPHVSIGGGVENAPLNAVNLGATAFGMFTKNQKQWHAAPYTGKNIEMFAANIGDNGYDASRVLPHAGYLINLANPADEPYERSIAALIDEMERCGQLGLDRLNLHPGSHLRQLTVEQALERVGKAINTVLEKTTGVTVVIENTAGQGASLGRTFEELATIRDHVTDKSRVGFCLDTAHMFAAGIDVRTQDDCRRMLDDFDKTVGADFLRGMHLNDSKVPFESNVDRHAPLGQGHIGWEPFKVILRDKRCANIPLVLETPDEELWPQEIRQLLDMAD